MTLPRLFCCGGGCCSTWNFLQVSQNFLLAPPGSAVLLVVLNSCFALWLLIAKPNRAGQRLETQSTFGRSVNTALLSLQILQRSFPEHRDILLTQKWFSLFFIYIFILQMIRCFTNHLMLIQDHMLRTPTFRYTWSTVGLLFLHYILFIYLFITFIGVTLANKITQVSSVHF